MPIMCILYQNQKNLPKHPARNSEINPNHKIVLKIGEGLKKNDNQDENAALVHLLYDQACIIEGEPVPDAGAFSKRLNSILEEIA